MDIQHHLKTNSKCKIRAISSTDDVIELDCTSTLINIEKSESGLIVEQKLVRQVPEGCSTSNGIDGLKYSRNSIFIWGHYAVDSLSINNTSITAFSITAMKSMYERILRLEREVVELREKVVRV
jgi:hypothetical protein